MSPILSAPFAEKIISPKSDPHLDDYLESFQVIAYKHKKRARDNTETINLIILSYLIMKLTTIDSEDKGSAIRFQNGKYHGSPRKATMSWDGSLAHSHCSNASMSSFLFSLSIVVSISERDNR